MGLSPPTSILQIYTIRLPPTADRLILKIYDITGKLIWVEEFNDSGVAEWKIFLRGIKDGVYFLKVGRETEKLIIKR